MRIARDSILEGLGWQRERGERSGFAFPKDNPKLPGRQGTIPSGKEEAKGDSQDFPPLGKCPKTDPRTGMEEQGGHQDGLSEIWGDFVFLSKPGEVWPVPRTSQRVSCLLPSMGNVPCGCDSLEGKPKQLKDPILGGKGKSPALESWNDSAWKRLPAHLIPLLSTARDTSHYPKLLQPWMKREENPQKREISVSTPSQQEIKISLV